MMTYNLTEISVQVERYFSVLHHHPSGLKGGVFTYMEKNKFKEQYSNGYQKSINNIIGLLSKGERPVFVTLNSYKKYDSSARYCKRDDKYLWGIDTIMIDLDAPTELLGVEGELMQVLQWAWEHNRIPKPNLYSYTGSGGVHLYYCFERLPKTMKQSINALKWGIAEKIIEFEKDFPTRMGHTYKVDTKVFDNQRLDRVPGSIHEDTGIMCQCFATGQRKYAYKELLACFDEDRWRADYKIQNSRKYIEKTRNEPNKEKVVASAIATTPATPPIATQQLSHDDITDTDIKLTQKRIRAMLTLAKNGKEFKNCREIACFILRNWCMQLQYPSQKTSKILKEFNSYLKEPLSEKELFQNTRSTKLYKFTNAYLKNNLNLTDAEAAVFAKRYRPGDRKERTILDKINIAKLLLQGVSSEKICEELSISLSLLKRRRTEMKKAEGLEYWANLKLKNVEDTIKVIISKIKERVGMQNVAFRTFVEKVLNKKDDDTQMQKKKCFRWIKMLRACIVDFTPSLGYG